MRNSLVPVPGLARAGDNSGGDLQGGKRRVVPGVVVGATFPQSGLHGQHLGGTVQRLDVALLVDRRSRVPRALSATDHVCDRQDCTAYVRRGTPSTPQMHRVCRTSMYGMWSFLCVS